MQINWALWQQPNGSNCNYNYQFQSFHCAIKPRIKITWQEQLQQVYQSLLTQHTQQFSSIPYGAFGSPIQPFNCSNYTAYNQPYSSSTTKTKRFTTNPSKPSKVIITTLPSDNNNEGTMEPKDFVIPTRFNAFAVNFKNFNALTEDQVHDIFVVYGKIKRIKQTGDEHGLCFVNFEAEEDAIKAAAGVKNHPDIKLRPSKFDRSKKSADNNFSSQNFNNGNSNYNYSNDDNANNCSTFTNSNKNNYSNGNENAKKNYSNGNSDNNYSNSDSKNNSNDKIRNNYSNSDGKNNSNDKRRNNYSNDSKNNSSNNPNSKIDSVSGNWPVVSTSSELKTSAITEPPEVSVSVSNYDNKQEAITTLEPFESSVPTSESVINHKNSEQHSTVCSKSESPIPDLVAKVTRFSSMNNVNSVPLVPIEKMAVEIMVANIQEGINLHAILQLLDKYHPLAATNIRTYGPNNMRYCRVYFTSQERAEDVETEFNNCVLMGKPLLVMRASCLVN